MQHRENRLRLLFSKSSIVYMITTVYHMSVQQNVTMLCHGVVFETVHLNTLLSQIHFLIQSLNLKIFNFALD